MGFNDILNEALANQTVLVAVVVYFLVYALKKTPFVNNKYITVISVVFGALVGLVLGLLETNISWDVGLVSGIISSSLAVLGTTILKDFRNDLSGKSNDDDDDLGD